ncbi:MAG: hypothetical protein WB696_08150, partial [Chthoniobacterales bacterium]
MLDESGACGVLDDVRSGLEHLFRLILSHVSGAMTNNGDCGFVVAPTEQLRINFEVAPKSDATGDPA